MKPQISSRRLSSSRIPPTGRVGRTTLAAAGLALTVLSVGSTTWFSAGRAVASSSRPVIEIGSRGAVVRTWQSDLDRTLPKDGAVAVDGIFGPLTRRATTVFQARHHIAVDGIVGPVTWAALPAALGGAPSRRWAACTTAHLRASLGEGSGAAGSVDVPLDLTNVGPTPCVTAGYPGVSYVTGNAGTQVGSAAARMPGESPTTVTIAPGRHATATLREVDAFNFPPGSCRLTATRGLRVYPPDQWTALFVAVTGDACATPADTGLVVTVLQTAHA